MIDAPILEIICIWIVGISATITAATIMAILVGVSDKSNRFTCRVPGCRAHDHIRSDQPSFPQPGEFIRLTTPSYFDEYGFARDVVAEPVEKDPYLEYGEAEVEVLLS